MPPWKLLRTLPKRASKSATMSKASSWTETSSCCFGLNLKNEIELTFQKLCLISINTRSIAVVSRPVMRLHMLPDKPPGAWGNSAMTVLSPMLEMSLSCSLCDIMLAHNASTIVSTWNSFTLLTRGPKLNNEKLILTVHFFKFKK